MAERVDLDEAAQSLKLKETFVIDSLSEDLNVEIPDNDNNSVPESQASILEFPDLGKRFHVQSLLGSGGMGHVYKATDTISGTVVAVKVLDKRLVDDPVALKKFEQEAEAAQKLDHPNLVPVYEHGRTPDGTPFVVMECVDGRNLGQVLEDKGFFASDDALDLLIDLAFALEAAHKEGVIHKDIKPGNVIIQESGDGSSRRPRLVDFGIATVMVTGAGRETLDLTQTGEVFGSPHYMSPEQCLGFMLDQRSDIYSFGCLMYEVITGKPPFAGSNPVQIIVKHINETAPGFSRDFKGSKQSRDLERVVLRCLEKEQSLRYQNIAELRSDLEKVKSGKPIPLYAKGAKNKHKLTTTQAIIGMSIAMFVMYCAPAVSDFLPYPIITFIQWGIPTLICMGSIYVTAFNSWQRLTLLLRDGGTERQWNMFFLVASLSGLGISCAPLLLLCMSGMFFSYVNDLVYGITFLSIASSAIFAFSIAMCGISYIFAGSSKKIGALLPISRILLTSAGVIILAITTMPSQCSSVSDKLASFASRPFPRVALSLLVFSEKLQPDAKNSQFLADLRISLIHDPQEKLKQISNYVDSLSPDLSNFYRSRRAELYQQMGNLTEAEADLDYLINDKSDYGSAKNSTAYYERGQARLKQGKLEQSLEDFDRSISISPTYDNRARAARIGVFLARGDEAKALEEAENACRKFADESNYPYDLMMGILLENAGQKDKAQTFYKKQYDKFTRSKEGTKPERIFGGPYFGRVYYFPGEQFYLQSAYVASRLGFVEEFDQQMLDFVKAKKKRGQHSGDMKMPQNNLDEVLLNMLSLEGTNLKLQWPADAETYLTDTK